MIFYYRNSFLASMVSIFGCVFAMAGVMALLEGEILVGLGGIALGMPFLIWAKTISENKAFKKWWKQITDNNLEPEIAKSAETAMAIYQKNPQQRTIEAIRKLNPEAAAWIQGGGKGPAPQAKQVPKPKPIQQPVQQPAPRQEQQSDGNRLEETLAQVRSKAQANTSHDPAVYWECAHTLEKLVPVASGDARLQQELAQQYTNYASSLKNPGFRDRKKAVEVLIRAMNVDKTADTARKDNRVLWMHVHAMMASGDAKSREELQEARELLRQISGYRIQNPNEKMRKLMDVSVPVARCRVNSHLAKHLSEQYPVDLPQALKLAEEAVQLCPLDLMRLNDLNPYMENETAVILTRKSMIDLRNTIQRKSGI